MLIPEPGQSLDDWYTGGQAAEVLSANSHRTVRPDYVRTLASQGLIRTKKMHARSTLYLKVDVDAYIVEDRGTKAGTAAKARSKQHEQ